MFFSRLRRWAGSLLGYRGPYMSSRYSRERLYHRSGSDCFYMENILARNRRYFRSRQAAEASGLRYCPQCREGAAQKSIRDFV